MRSRPDRGPLPAVRRSRSGHEAAWRRRKRAQARLRARHAAWSHLALAQVRDRIGRMPARGRADAVAIGVDVQEIGPSVRGRALGALDRAFELVRLFNHLALDAERLGGLGVVDVRAPEVAGHVAAGLELPAAVMPDAVALVVVAVIVEHDVDDRRLVARLGPQRLRAGEAEAAVADDRNHGHIRPGELGAERRRQAPSQDVRTGADVLLVAAAEGQQWVDGLAGIHVADVAGVLVERAFELDPDALEARGRALRVFARDGLAELAHLRAVGAGAGGALLGDLFEPRRSCQLADRRREVGSREPHIGHHAEVDGTAAGEARGIETDRNQLHPGRGALAVAVAEAQQHVDLAGIAHVAQLRPDVERMAGWKRPRPEA